MNVAVKRQQRLARFNEAAHRDASNVTIQRRMIDRFSVQSRAIEVGLIRRRMKKENAAGQIFVSRETLQILLNRRILQRRSINWNAMLAIGRFNASGIGITGYIVFLPIFK